MLIMDSRAPLVQCHHHRTTMHAELRAPDEARFYMTDKRVVLTTAGTPEEARRIARLLVESRLAACVNITPVGSIYRWEGKVEEASEHLLIIKTTEAAIARLQEALRQAHSYDVPECIALAVEDGSLPYLKWITESVD